MMPSVKGLHYALRIWTRQIFGLVIMMLYPLPPRNQVLHQAQCFCIPKMAQPTPHQPLSVSQAKWEEIQYVFHISGILKEAKAQKDIPPENRRTLVVEYLWF